MKRLSKELIDQIVSRHKNGESLNKLAKKFSLNKTTIYYHTRKAIGRKIQPVKFNLTNLELVGEFIGEFAGDGNFYLDKNYKYTIKFYFSIYEKEYAERIIELIRILFGKKAYSYKIKNANEIVVGIISKDIYKLIKKFLEWNGKKTYSVKLKGSITKLDERFLIGFLRGLINSDGSIYLPKNRISFGTVSKVLSNQVSFLLNYFGIKHSIYKIKGKNNRKLFYHIHITGLKEIRKFRDKINLTNVYKKVQLESIMSYAAMV